MADKPISGSNKIALASLGFGAVVAVGIGSVVPHLVWWGYPAITFIVAAIAYPQWLQMIANEKIIDRGDWPTKDEK